MNLLPDIKNILYCTRIGPNSAYIYRYAMALAEKFDAGITVLHVMETLTAEQEAMINGYIGPASIPLDLYDGARIQFPGQDQTASQQVLFAHGRKLQLQHQGGENSRCGGHIAGG